jgi:hypothetical protein
MLVIASHKNYRSALEKILGNLDYLHFDLTKVAVVIAGSDVEEPEYATTNGVHFIKVATNFYELTAIYGIYVSLEELFPNEKHFVFIQDTSILLHHFNDAYQSFINKMERDQADVYYASLDKRCNIVGLSRYYIEKCGNEYGITTTKQGAWDVEENRSDLSFQKMAMKHKMKTICYLKPTECAKSTIKYEGSDIVRIRVFFETLGLIKLVASNENINPPWEKRIYP